MPKAKLEENRDKRTLITGASAGIGAALAEEFAKHGHPLILVARRKEKLAELAERLSAKHGIAVTTISADLASAEAAATLFAETQARELRVDILVNNAGLLCEGEFTSLEHAPQEQLLQLNINALTALTHHYARAMQNSSPANKAAKQRGRIVNICSTSAFQPIPTLACYAASKAYVLSFSEALNTELSQHGITVTCICPGFTNTDMIQQEQRDKSMSLPFVKNLEASTVAAETYAACMTGQALKVNGLSNQALTTLSSLQPRWLQRLINKGLAKHGF